MGQISSGQPINTASLISTAEHAALIGAVNAIASKSPKSAALVSTGIQLVTLIAQHPQPSQMFSGLFSMFQGLTGAGIIKF